VNVIKNADLEAAKAAARSRAAKKNAQRKAKRASEGSASAQTAVPDITNGMASVRHAS
jgi:septal ring factor EnvC (AmiA/AmiB activator)